LAVGVDGIMILTDIIKTEADLNIVKEAMLPVFEKIGVSKEKVNQIPIRFGKKQEFKENSTAFYNTKEIVISNGLSCCETLSALAHE